MSDRLPLLLGESPSRSGDAYYRFPLSGRVARTLCELAGIPPDEEGTTYGRWTWALYARFECRNLFQRHAQATPWSVPAARARAITLTAALCGDVVVCLGRRVHAAVYGALGEAPPGFHVWETIPLLGDEDALRVVAVPHPSGLNRLLNDPAERARVGETLRAVRLAGR
jgi:uracil-DNA glycosylase